MREVPEPASAGFHERVVDGDCSLDVAENQGIHFFCVGDRRSAKRDVVIIVVAPCQTVSCICLDAPG
jgi:hypothetical protein